MVDVGDHRLAQQLVLFGWCFWFGWWLGLGWWFDLFGRWCGWRLLLLATPRTHAVLLHHLDVVGRFLDFAADELQIVHRERDRSLVGVDTELARLLVLHVELGGAVGFVCRWWYLLGNHEKLFQPVLLEALDQLAFAFGEVDDAHGVAHVEVGLLASTLVLLAQVGVLVVVQLGEGGTVALVQLVGREVLVGTFAVWLDAQVAVALVVVEGRVLLDEVVPACTRGGTLPLHTCLYGLVDTLHDALAGALVGDTEELLDVPVFQELAELAFELAPVVRLDDCE